MSDSEQISGDNGERRQGFLSPLLGLNTSEKLATLKKMAGRGRGSTLPAWMTQGEGLKENTSLPGPDLSGGVPNPVAGNGAGAPPPLPSGPPPASAYTEASLAPQVASSSLAAAANVNPLQKFLDPTEPPEWEPLSVSRDRRKSNWDVKVGDGGLESMLAANPYAAMSLAGMGGGGPVANPTAFVQQQLNSFNNLPTNKRGTNSAAFGGGAGADADFQAQRHARRLYVGSIPPGSNDRSVEAFFVDIFRRTITPPDMDWLREHGAGTQKQPLIVSVHYNETKGYAFVEFNCVELAMAAIDLDGISWNGTCIKVRRPNDFRAEAMAPMRRLITVNKAALGIVSGQVVDGPNKVFIGGLPYHLKDEQVKELLGAFGQLKSFRLVRESGSETSKGYGFFEYLDPSVTAMAVEGLNGMPVGDKSLTVKMAENPMHGGTSAAAQATAAQQALANQSLAFGALAAQMQMGNMPPGLEALGAADGSSDLGTVPTAPRPYYEKDVRVNSVNCTLVLMHMVTSEELMDDEEFGDIVEDVTEECGQYGKVENLWIPRVKDDYPDDRQGNIYVEFDCTASAQKAKQALAGRKFSERTVMVDWFVNNP